MPDSPNPADAVGLPDVPAVKPAKSPAAIKSAADAKTVAAERRAAKRLGKILDGAALMKTTGLFRGPLDYAALKQHCGDFAKYDAAVIGAPKVGTSTSEALGLVTRESELVVAAILDYVEAMYPLGTEGRAAFFPGGGGQKPLDVELEAALKGVAVDAAGNKFLPAVAETDPKAGAALLTKLRAAMKANQLELATHDDNKSLRAQSGKSIRSLVKRAEMLVRTYHKATPGLLLKYGLKPGLRALVGPQK